MHNLRGLPAIRHLSLPEGQLLLCHFWLHKLNKVLTRFTPGSAMLSQHGSTPSFLSPKPPPPPGRGNFSAARHYGKSGNNYLIIQSPLLCFKPSPVTAQRAIVTLSLLVKHKLNKVLTQFTPGSAMLSQHGSTPSFYHQNPLRPLAGGTSALPGIMGNPAIITSLYNHHCCASNRHLSLPKGQLSPGMLQLTTKSQRSSFQAEPILVFSF
jgi:hypothetical protein